MASKRFTDVDKWDDPWFGELSNEHKLLWLFMLDRCDSSGVYKVYPKRAQEALGFSVDWQEWEGILNGRIHKLAPDKWFIPKFIQFQYGTLTYDCKPHVPIINNLLSLGVLKEEEIKGYPKGINTLNTRKDKTISIQEKKGNPECRSCHGDGVIYAPGTGKMVKCNCLEVLTAHQG